MCGRVPRPRQAEPGGTQPGCARAGSQIGARPRWPRMELGPGATRGFSVSVSPVGLPHRASSRMAPSTSTSTSPRAASTRTPGRRPCTAGSPPSTCHGVSTPAVWPAPRAGRDPGPRRLGSAGQRTQPVLAAHQEIPNSVDKTQGLRVTPRSPG